MALQLLEQEVLGLQPSDLVNSALPKDRDHMIRQEGAIVLYRGLFARSRNGDSDPVLSQLSKGRRLGLVKV